jgi:anti-anti-sigma factor
MNLDTFLVDGITVLQPTNRFDAHYAKYVNEWFQQIAAEPRMCVLVDMVAVRFIDSFALATLLKGMRLLQERRGTLTLCSIQQPVRIILELTRVDRVLSIYPDRDSAISAVQYGEEWGRAA